MSHAERIWDACSLLNLAATGRIRDIISGTDSNYLVAEVRRNEVFKLRSLPEEQSSTDFVEFDFSIYIEEGLFQEVDLTPAEQATFEQFAVEIDDGEARTAAVAVHRGFCVVT